LRSNQIPSVPQAALLLLANFLLQYVIHIAIYDLQGLLELTKYQQNALAMLLANGILLATVTHYQNRTYSDLIHPSQSSWFATVVLLAPAVLMLVPGLLLLNQGVFELLMKIWAISKWEEEFFEMFKDGEFTAILYTSVLAPVFEEIVFRGVFLRSFLARYPRWPAIAFSALLFGFAHLNIYQFSLAFPMGLLLGWLFERSHSLIPCITLHVAFNTAAVALNLSFSNEKEPSISDLPTVVWLFFVTAFAAGTWFLVRTLTKKSKASDISSIRKNQL